MGLSRTSARRSGPHPPHKWWGAAQARAWLMDALNSVGDMSHVMRHPPLCPSVQLATCQGPSRMKLLVHSLSWYMLKRVYADGHSIDIVIP